MREVFLGKFLVETVDVTGKLPDPTKCPDVIHHRNVEIKCVGARNRLFVAQGMVYWLSIPLQTLFPIPAGFRKFLASYTERPAPELLQAFAKTNKHNLCLDFADFRRRPHYYTERWKQGFFTTAGVPLRQGSLRIKKRLQLAELHDENSPGLTEEQMNSSVRYAQSARSGTPPAGTSGIRPTNDMRTSGKQVREHEPEIVSGDEVTPERRERPVTPARTSSSRSLSARNSRVSRKKTSGKEAREHEEERDSGDEVTLERRTSGSRRSVTTARTSSSRSQSTRGSRLSRKSNNHNQKFRKRKQLRSRAEEKQSRAASTSGRDQQPSAGDDSDISDEGYLHGTRITSAHPDLDSRLMKQLKEGRVTKSIDILDEIDDQGSTDSSIIEIVHRRRRAVISDDDPSGVDDGGTGHSLGHINIERGNAGASYNNRQCIVGSVFEADSVSQIASTASRRGTTISMRGGSHNGANAEVMQDLSSQRRHEPRMSSSSQRCPSVISKETERIRQLERNDRMRATNNGERIRNADALQRDTAREHAAGSESDVVHRWMARIRAAESSTTTTSATQAAARSWGGNGSLEDISGGQQEGSEEIDTADENECRGDEEPEIVTKRTRDKATRKHARVINSTHTTYDSSLFVCVTDLRKDLELAHTRTGKLPLAVPSIPETVSEELRDFLLDLLLDHTKLKARNNVLLRKLYYLHERLMNVEQSRGGCKCRPERSSKISKTLKTDIPVDMRPNVKVTHPFKEEIIRLKQFSPAPDIKEPVNFVEYMLEQILGARKHLSLLTAGSHSKSGREPIHFDLKRGLIYYALSWWDFPTKDDYDKQEQSTRAALQARLDTIYRDHMNASEVARQVIKDPEMRKVERRLRPQLRHAKKSKLVITGAKVNSLRAAQCTRNGLRKLLRRTKLFKFRSGMQEELVEEIEDLDPDPIELTNLPGDFAEGSMSSGPETDPFAD